MIDLSDIGINKELLNEIIKYNNETIVFSLINNKENIKKIIDYFKSIGINNIDELLKFEIDIFLDDIENIKNRINESDKDLIDSINNDCICIEDI